MGTEKPPHPGTRKATTLGVQSISSEFKGWTPSVGGKHKEKGYFIEDWPQARAFSANKGGGERTAPVGVSDRAWLSIGMTTSLAARSLPLSQTDPADWHTWDTWVCPLERSVYATEKENYSRYQWVHGVQWLACTTKLTRLQGSPLSCIKIKRYIIPSRPSTTLPVSKFKYLDSYCPASIFDASCFSLINFAPPYSAAHPEPACCSGPDTPWQVSSRLQTCRVWETFSYRLFSSASCLNYSCPLFPYARVAHFTLPAFVLRLVFRMSASSINHPAPIAFPRSRSPRVFSLRNALPRFSCPKDCSS